MAKSQQIESPQPPPLWTPEDLPRLAESLERVESQLSSIAELLKGTVTRLDAVEATVALIDPDKTSMPLELSRTLNLANAYNAGITGSLMSAFLANPNLLADKRYLRKRMNEVLDLADELVAVLCERHGTKPKLKAE